MFSMTKNNKLTVIADETEIYIICKESRYMLNEQNTNKAFFATEFAAALYITYRACGYSQKEAYQTSKVYDNWNYAQSGFVPDDIAHYAEEIRYYTDYMINRTVYAYR